MADIYRTETPTGILYADINLSTSGTLVTGVSGKKIVVLSVSLVAESAVNATFQTSTGSTDIGGPYYCAANGGIVLPFNAGGWFQTNVGDSLLLNLSGSVSVGGSISYVLV